MFRITIPSFALSAILGLIICFTFSCGDRAVSLPIEEEKLIDMLCDVHIMEGALQNKTLTIKDSVARLYYDQIYEKHQIEEERFIRSLELMEENPKKLESIYAKVLVRLDTLEERFNKSKSKKK